MSGPTRVFRLMLAWTAGAFLVAVLPFFVLVRVAVATWRGWGLGGWTALAVGVLALVAVVALPAAVLAWRRREGWPGARRLLGRGAAALGAVLVVYGVVWVGPLIAEDPSVRVEYRTLHPVLRMAVAPVFAADPGRVQTDAFRTLEDYRLMGLPVDEASLHFVGEDGSVRAVDFRTRGRPEWGNRVVELGFWILGLHSFRHRGVADHLHVSLRSGGGGGR